MSHLLDGFGRRRRERSEPRPEPVEQSVDTDFEGSGSGVRLRPARHPRHVQPVEEPEEPRAASIRPYAWTGGRTRSQVQLELETLVSTSEHYQPGAQLRLEHQSVMDLCGQPRSVAEVGALLSVPLGVARVLLADLAELGHITVHDTVSENGSAPHLKLMERVLSGLRRL